MHFGVSAAKQALIDSGFEITDANREDVGVVFGSGAGGQQLMIEAWVALHEKGPRSVPPTFIANALVDSAVGHDRDRDRRHRPQRLHRVGLRHGYPQRRRGCRGDPPRGLHRGDLGLDRGAAPRDGPRRVHEHARDGPAATGRAAPDGVAAVRRDPRRLRPWRGRRVAVPRGPRAGQGSRRADLRGGRRLRLGGRWLGHGPADRQGRRVRPGDEDGARAARRTGRRGRPDQPPRNVDAARRQARGRGDLDGLRRRTRRTSRSARRSR